jgi:energy-converting hydrogenase Eha subunit F
MNSHSIARLAALALALVATTASASFHTFVIESIYSNADGTVQYVGNSRDPLAPAAREALKRSPG